MPRLASQLVDAPQGGVYRTARWPDPFEWPPPPHPMIGSKGVQTWGNRWDDPAGEYSTLYCASDREAAFGETIAVYRERLLDGESLLERIDAFFDDAPDPEHDPALVAGEVSPDYFDDRVVGHAKVEADARFVDADAPDTHRTLNVSLKGLLDRHGLRGFDRGVVLSADRRLTRPIARHYHELAQTPDHSELAGLRYESRLYDGWECWAIWEPSPLQISPRHPPVPVTREDADLRSAAHRLGVGIPLP